MAETNEHAICHPVASHIASGLGRHVSVFVFSGFLKSLLVLHLLAALVMQALTWNVDRLLESFVWLAACLAWWGLIGSKMLRPVFRLRTKWRRLRGLTVNPDLMAACLWSVPWSAALVLALPEETAGRLLTLCILLVLVAGTVQIFGRHFRAAAANAACILLPACVILFAGGDRLERILALALLGFLALYLVQGSRAARQMLEETQHDVLEDAENGITIAQLREKVMAETCARVRVEEALTQAVQACRDKSRFLAAASHDLRQPMHAITLFLGALKAEPFDSRPRYLLDRLDRSVAGLDDLFNRLLDISHLDAGLVEPTVRAIDASSLAQTLESRFLPVAAAKSIRFHVVCPTGLRLQSDPELLIELLSNLLSNAFRYTERGGVLLAFRRRGDHALVQVWDTGCGVAQENLGLIFEEFVQLNNPARDRRKGQGLGLAIVRRLANILGYPIEVRSRPGRGSVFEMRLACSLDACPAPFETMQPGGMTSTLKGALVLVVDDENDILGAMEAILASWGCLSILARSVEDAVKYVDNSPRYPDVIITDHRLAADQDSTDVATALASLLPGEIPIIVVSGEADPLLEKEIAGRGWMFMSKPVNPSRLHAVISCALEKTAALYEKVA
jgi:two-component system, sensor histidine kinase